jgi:hypothetical protein
MITPPSHCPRCNQEWGIFEMARRCYQCKMTFVFTPGNVSGWYCWKINNCSLFWNIAEQQCIYQIINPHPTPIKEIQLLWLPLTITEQQLKLYLTFQ